MFSNILLSWYDQNARSLPWRASKDPYRIWVSEIMLQQTRAEAVIRYYERFLARYPDVHALAAADTQELLKLWEGLGYYSRARNLQAAARIISENGGDFPVTVDGLQALPGIGPYAARAIASIAFNICAPALDGNQMRVLSRVFAVERVLKTPFDLEEEAMACISQDRPGDYNQALMDLGSAICTPKNPKCSLCPLASLCHARADGNPERYPLRPAPVPRREEERSVLIIFTEEGVCVRKRPSKGLLANFWEFPTLDGHIPPEEILEALRDQGFINPEIISPLGSAKHVFTHIIWRMQGWQLQADAIPEGMAAVDPDGLRALPFPSALRFYRELAGEILARHNRI